MSETDNTPPIFEYGLSDDKTTLTIQLRDGIRQYTADEVTKLAIFFANLRTQMIPPVPNDSYLDSVPPVECARYEIYQKTTDGTAQIYLQLPGLVWAFLPLTKEDAVRAAEYLDPSRAIQDGSIAH